MDRLNQDYTAQNSTIFEREYHYGSAGESWIDPQGTLAFRVEDKILGDLIRAKSIKYFIDYKGEKKVTNQMVKDWTRELTEYIEGNQTFKFEDVEGKVSGLCNQLDENGDGRIIQYLLENHTRYYQHVAEYTGLGVTEDDHIDRSTMANPGLGEFMVERKMWFSGELPPDYTVYPLHKMKVLTTK